MISEARYIEIDAEPRYWEDATINGVEAPDSGDGVPFKSGNNWKVVIRIEDGRILNWPEDVEARFHFKVCDQGEYRLLDDVGSVIAKSIGDYVPSGICHGKEGYGDYIIFNVGKNGKIENYSNKLDYDSWIEQ